MCVAPLAPQRPTGRFLLTSSTCWPGMFNPSPVIPAGRRPGSRITAEPESRPILIGAGARVQTELELEFYIRRRGVPVTVRLPVNVDSVWPGAPV